MFLDRHRVVRGSLLVCGRPDGRLTALTTLEASTCLAVNQASSIQSLGGTCESITIGHNDATLPLSYRGICLEDYRPKFLCKKMLDDQDKEALGRSICDNETESVLSSDDGTETKKKLMGAHLPILKRALSRRESTNGDDELSRSQHFLAVLRRGSTSGDDNKIEQKQSLSRSSGALLGESFPPNTFFLF